MRSNARGLFQPIQKNRELCEIVNLVIWFDIRVFRPMLRIKPACSNAGVDAAENIAGQTVSDQYCAIRLKLIDLRKAAVKKLYVGLIRADDFRNENALGRMAQDIWRRRRDLNSR